MAKRTSKRRSRLGQFTASGTSRPTFDGEAPHSNELAYHRLADEYSPQAAGEEVFKSIDQMLALAQEVARDTRDGEVDPGPDDGWWTDDRVVMRGLAADSARGFAIRLMLNAAPITSRLMSTEPMTPEDAAFLARDVLRFAALYNALKAEWIDGPDVAASKAAQADRSEGGRQKAQAASVSIRRRHAEWQRAADDVWRSNPTMTKSAVAGVVARKVLANAELFGTANTIRAVIKKPD